jgi:hypothetical protein
MKKIELYPLTHEMMQGAEDVYDEERAERFKYPTNNYNKDLTA